LYKAKSCKGVETKTRTTTGVNVGNGEQLIKEW